jgi:hypothetical protein
MMKLVPLGCLVFVGGLALACGDAGMNTLRDGTSAGAGGSSAGAGAGDDGGSAGATSAGGNDSNGGTSSGTSSGPAVDGGAVADGGSGATATGPVTPAGAGLPCDVAALLASKCVTCHADPPLNGSLSGLVTVSDLMATSKEDPTQNEAQLSLARMQSAASPMPPTSVGAPATAAEIQAFQQWVSGGYQGSCGDAAAPPPASDVFTGAPAFASSVAASTHNARQDCMGGCHDHGFTLAGTLTDGKGNGVAGAEVRLVDASGKVISVHTGSNGNFHSSTPFAGPAKVGARDATNKALMVTTLQPASGGCNGCHATGATTAPIHLP